MRYPSLYASLPLILSLLMVGCAGLEQREEAPRVNLVNLRILDVQLFEQRYGVTLRIINPDRRELSIEGFSFEVELNGQEFAYGVSGDPVVIPGFGEETLEVEVISTLFSVVEQLHNLERRSGQPLEYRIHGRISITGGLMSIPFEQQGSIGPARTGQSTAGPSTNSRTR